MNKLIALLLISSQAFAGLPPTTTRGQSDSTAKTTFNFQAPHNQVTQLDGAALIETGNGNILPDAGFEAKVSGWSASGGATATANSTAKGTGAKGYDWDSNSAAQTLQSTSVTIPAGLAGKNGIAYCNIKTVSGTATHTFTVNDGTNDIVTPITIQSSTTAFLGSNEGNKINFVFPTSGTIRIKLAAVNANEPEIYIDDCSIQLANNVYDAPLVTAWAAYTPTFTGFGTATSVQFQYRRNGENIEVRGSFLSGTPTATEARVSFPNSLVSAGTSKIPSIQIAGTMMNNESTGAVPNWLVLLSANEGYFKFSRAVTPNTSFFTAVNANTIISSGSKISVIMSAPISGWSAVSAVSADQADYDWTSYTPTFTGFGTVTGIECQQQRVTSNLNVRCKFTSGAVTAAEARISLPSGLTSADTTKIPSLQMIGRMSINSNGAYSTSVLIEPSVTYFTFGVQFAGSNDLTKANGTALTANGNLNSFFASIPIQGWSSNQRAPTLVGSVTSNSASAMRFEATTISNTGTPTLVTQSSSWINSLTDNGTGDTTVNFVAGTFSSPPWCTCSSYDGDFAHCSIDATTAISSSLVRVQTDSNGSSAADRQFILMCIGPR